MQISEITDFRPDGEPHPDLVAVTDLWSRWSHDALGHDDFQYTPHELAVRCSRAEHRRTCWWIARDGDETVGALELGAPLSDNLRLVELEAATEPGRDPAPILDLLWEAARARMAELGRTTATTFTLTAADGRGLDGPDDLLTPASGSGAIPRDAYAAWLLGRGFVLEQVERASLLDLTGGLPDLTALERDAQAAGEAYDIVTWTGTTPEHLVEPLCHLRERMSVDAPMAGLDLEQEHWDAERVRTADRLADEMHRLQVWAVAVHRATGELAGHTQLMCPLDKPEVAYQADTLVLREHRGHRLGMRLKLANLRQLHEARPQVGRVRTWNAHENRWMLAVNEALGFTPAALEGCWQRKM